MIDIYLCVRCKRMVSERITQPLKGGRGLCLPCAIKSLNLRFQEEDAMADPIEKIETPVPDSPPPGKKFCGCGCKGLLPADSYWSHIRGHRAAKAKAAASPLNASKLPDILKELREEINWREKRQRELEQEMGLNIQKIRLLRNTAQALEAAL